MGEITGIGESPVHVRPLGGVACAIDSPIPETSPPPYPSQPNTHSTHQHNLIIIQTQNTLNSSLNTHPNTHPNHHPHPYHYHHHHHLTPLRALKSAGRMRTLRLSVMPQDRNSKASRSAGNTPALLGARGRRTLSPVEARPTTLPWPVLQGREWKGEERLPPAKYVGSRVPD